VLNIIAFFVIFCVNLWCYKLRGEEEDSFGISCCTCQKLGDGIYVSNLTLLEDRCV